MQVLAPKKDAVENKNRKDYATEKWEQEVRDSLSKKKTTTNVKLSKADQAAVAAQMAKEAGIRQQIIEVQARLRRGVELVRSLVASNAEAMERHVGELAKMLLHSVFGVGSFLADNKAFEVFLVSSEQASEVMLTNSLWAVWLQIGWASIDVSLLLLFSDHTMLLSSPMITCTRTLGVGLSKGER